MISGGIKFFRPNRVLGSDAGTIAATSGDIVSANAIDKNPITFWTSVGSDDTTTETLIQTFPETQIDRLLFQDHNFKEFVSEYWNGSSWTAFTDVVGIDGPRSGISETDFADDTAYYETALVTTTGLRTQVTKTQVPDAQKFITQIIATTEIGTLQGFPTIKAPAHSRNSRVKPMLSGKVLVQKGIDSFAVTLDFDRYPTSLVADLDLAMSLFDEEDPFLVWLCGGRRGASYFRYTPRGMRLKDIYLMQLTKDVKPELLSGVYINPVSIQLTLEEHV